MKFQITSDIHLEFYQEDQKKIEMMNSILAPADILILAGDINYTQGVGKINLAYTLDYFSERYKYVLFVFGNHDLYWSSFSGARKALERVKSNVYVLDNKLVEIDGKRFIGATLFFKQTPMTMTRYKWFVDFNEITNFKNDVYRENMIATKFLQDTVKKNDIVITHHAPCKKSIDYQFEGDPDNDFFVCDIESEVIHSTEPALWIHGHMHNTFHYFTFNTEVICHPYGYPTEDKNRTKILVLDLDEY